MARQEQCDSSIEPAVVRSAAHHVETELPHQHDVFAEAFDRALDAGYSLAEISLGLGRRLHAGAGRLILRFLHPDLRSQLMAGSLPQSAAQTLAAIDDHELQLRAWSAIASASDPGPAAVRRWLASQPVSAEDPRMRAVDLAAYIQAGGELQHDLFGAAPVALSARILDHLVIALLRTAATSILDEGWGWVGLAPRISAFERKRLSPAMPDGGPQRRAFRAGERWRPLVPHAGPDRRHQVASARSWATAAGWSLARRRRLGALITLDVEGRFEVLRGVSEVDLLPDALDLLHSPHRRPPARDLETEPCRIEALRLPLVTVKARMLAPRADPLLRRQIERSIRNGFPGRGPNPLPPRLGALARLRPETRVKRLQGLDQTALYELLAEIEAVWWVLEGETSASSGIGPDAHVWLRLPEGR